MNKQYQHFRTTTRQQLQDKTKEIHELYSTANTLYTSIKKNEEYLRFIGFTVDNLEGLNDRTKIQRYDIKAKNFDEDPKVVQLKTNIHAYTTILVDKIPQLRNEIKVLSLLASAPFGAFMDLYIAFNSCILTRILLGKEYRFPRQIGALQIFNFKRDFNKKAVDYGESMKLKAKGFKKYIVYNLEDYFTAPKYVKAGSKVPNYKYYSFKFTKFINGAIRLKEEYYNTMNNINDIIKDSNLGNWDKMLMIKKISNNQIYRNYD